MNALFLDSSFAIALASKSDQYNAAAMLVSRDIKSQGRRMVTTRAVVVEIGNALSKRQLREAAVSILESIEEDPDVEIVPLTEEFFQEALALYVDRRDKEWGLTDCVSFVVMRRRGLTDALTADAHFLQAGFSTLLSAQ